MKSSAPSIVASTIHGDTGRRRRSFVSAVQSLAADVRGHVQGRTQREETIPPPKIGHQIPPKAASILGRSIYSASRSVDNLSTTSMGARPRPSSSASAGSLGLAPTTRPLMTLRLSSTSFLDTTVSDDLQCQQLYAIQTRGTHTTIFREDAVQGHVRVGTICWRTEREEERMSLALKGDVTIQMANGRRRCLDDFLRSNKLLGSRKFNIPHYPYTLKWKRYGRIYNLTLSKLKKVVATLEPAVLSAPPRIRVYEPVYERDETRPQLEHQGVPIPLLDYLVTTSLLLVTEKDEWQNVNNGAGSSSNNDSAANLPSFRSELDDNSCGIATAVHSIHRWRSGVETEPFSSRPSSPALSSVGDEVISLATDESITALQTRARSGHGRTVSTADETASIPSFRSFYTDASVPLTIRPSSVRPPPQQRLPEPVRSSTDSETSAASILHPFATGSLNDDEGEDDLETFGKEAALECPPLIGDMCSPRTNSYSKDEHRSRSQRETDTRTIRASTMPPAASSTQSTSSSPEVRQPPPRSASVGDTSLDSIRRVARPRPLPRPPAPPPTTGIPPVPKLSPETFRLYSENHSGPSSSRRMASSPLSSSFSAVRHDSLSNTGLSASAHLERQMRSQTLRRIASDSTISPVSTSSTHVFEHSSRVSPSEPGPMPYKRPPPSDSHDDFNPYEDSAFIYTASSSRHHDHYQNHYQGPLPLRVQNLPDNGGVVDPLASPADAESVYHSPPMYPHSPPESSYLCGQPPPAYDSIDFSRS